MVTGRHTQTDRQTNAGENILLRFGGDNYRGHHVKLESHGDDVESDDAGDGQVEVLAADDDVDDQSRLGISRPVRQLAQPYSVHSTVVHA